MIDSPKAEKLVDQLGDSLAYQIQGRALTEYQWSVFRNSTAYKTIVSKLLGERPSVPNGGVA